VGELDVAAEQGDGRRGALLKTMLVPGQGCAAAMAMGCVAGTLGPALLSTASPGRAWCPLPPKHSYLCVGIGAPVFLRLDLLTIWVS